jgi:hypothetical protein
MWFNGFLNDNHYELGVHFLGITWIFQNLSVPLDDLPFQFITFMVEWSKSFKTMWLSWFLVANHYELRVYFLGRTWTFQNLSVPLDDLPFQLNTFMVDWSKSFKTMWFNGFFNDNHYELRVHFLGIIWTFQNLLVPLDDLSFQFNTFMVEWSKSFKTMWLSCFLVANNYELRVHFLRRTWTF